MTEADADVLVESLKRIRRRLADNPKDWDTLLRAKALISVVAKEKVPQSVIDESKALEKVISH